VDTYLNIALSICIVGLVSVSLGWARKSGEWGSFSAGLAALIAFVVFLRYWFGFPYKGHVPAKSGESGHNMVLTGALAICMLAGMFAQYLFRHFEREKRFRRKWDWGLFIAPIFASPIVFIPLAASFQNVDIDLTRQSMTLPRLMIFLVAFENGFFWKEYFDRKRKEEQRKK
jgi:hypothetical protein